MPHSKFLWHKFSLERLTAIPSFHICWTESGISEIIRERRTAGIKTSFSLSACTIIAKWLASCSLSLVFNLSVSRDIRQAYDNYPVSCSSFNDLSHFPRKIKYSNQWQPVRFCNVWSDRSENCKMDLNVKSGPPRWDSNPRTIRLSSYCKNINLVPKYSSFGCYLTAPPALTEKRTRNRERWIAKW